MSKSQKRDKWGVPLIDFREKQLSANGLLAAPNGGLGALANCSNV